MPRRTTKERGRLFLIGGSARLSLLRFVRLAGGSRAHVVVLPHASAQPATVARDLKQDLTKAGAGKVSLLMPWSPDGLPSGATAVLMAGGDQSRLVNVVRQPLRAGLEGFLEAGGLLAGTSAGAAAMPVTMIAEGMGDGVLRPGSLRLKPGFGFLPDVVVDTHFKERSRFGRLMAAVTLLPGRLGIGLDEDTALEVFADGTATVHGNGHVWFFVPGAHHASNLAVPSGKLKASVAGVEVSSLCDGERFDLRARRWIKKPHQGSDAPKEVDTDDICAGERFSPR